MPEIFLHLEGQQTGPHQVAQIRQLLAEGKVTGQTPAWYQGLAAWSTVAQILIAFPVEGLPPGAPPPPPLTPVKKGMPGWLLAVIIIGACFMGLGVLSCLAGIALGPITAGIEKAKESASLQQARAINLMMYSYSVDHNGAYPDGATSTDVFQKLLDEKYASDPTIFYCAMGGKTKPTSSKLTAENVCYDVTSGVQADSPGNLPVVFSTGYVMSYSAGTPATRESGASTAVYGIAVGYKDNSTRFLTLRPGKTEIQVIPASFDPGTKTYRQLKP